MPRGLYEALLTESLHSQLAELEDRYQTECNSLDSDEAANRLALHLSKLFHRALVSLEPEQRAAAGVSLARRLVAPIIRDTGADHLADQVPEALGQILRPFGGRVPDGSM